MWQYEGCMSRSSVDEQCRRTTSRHDQSLTKLHLCLRARAVLNFGHICTGWWRRIQFRKWNYSQWCLGDVLVKLERHLANSIQKNSISGVKFFIVRFATQYLWQFFYPAWKWLRKGRVWQSTAARGISLRVQSMKYLTIFHCPPSRVMGAKEALS